MIENRTTKVLVYQRNTFAEILIAGKNHTISAINNGNAEIYAAIDISIHGPIRKLLLISVIAATLTFSINATIKISRSRKKNNSQKNEITKYGGKILYHLTISI